MEINRQGHHLSVYGTERADYLIGHNGQPEIFDMGSGPEVFTRAWSPSTDIAHAWEVVEKIKKTITEDEYSFCININHGKDAEDDFYTAGLMDDYGEYVFKKNACADTAPHAICIAALMMVRS